MIKKIIQHYWEIFVIFFLSLTPIIWFHGGQIVLGHDSGFRLDPVAYLGRLWYSWNPALNFGGDIGANKGFLITQLPEAILAKISGSLSLGQMLSFIVWFFLIGVSMYVLLRNFFPDERFWPFRLFASAYYMYNFFLLQGWFIAERAKFSLFAALPFLFFILWNTLDRRYGRLKGSILFGITTLFLNGGGSPPLYGGILVMLGTVSFFFLLRSLWSRKIQVIIRVILDIVVVAAVSLVFNAYWIIPQVYEVLLHYSQVVSNIGGLNGILGWEAVVNKHASLLNLLRLEGIPDWYENSLHPYSSWYLTSPTLIILSFLPILVILYVLLRRDLWVRYERQHSFLFVVFLVLFVGFIFAAGSHPPFGFIYVLFLRYVPGFVMFRSAIYKFGPAVWFSMIILSGFSFYVLLTTYVRRRVPVILCGFLLISGILLYHFPYFGVNFFDWNKPFTTKVILPAYVNDMFSYINETYQNDTPRMMILPPLDSNSHADSYQWGFWSLDMLARLGTHIPVVANDTGLPIVSALYDGARDNNIHLFYALAGRLGIQKILWRGDVLYSEKETTSDNFSSIHDQLLGSSQVNVEKMSGKWTLYSIQDAQCQLPPVRAEPLVNRADMDETALQFLFKSADIQGTPIVSGGFLYGPKLEEQLRPFFQEDIVAAQCAFCDPNELSRIENMDTIQSVRFLPDSPFYIFVTLKEQKTLLSFKKMPAQRIDAELGFATKRIGEISNLLDRAIKDKSYELAVSNSVKFQQLIDDAVNTTYVLPEVDRNAYRAKIVAYLKFYIKYLSSLEVKNIVTKDLFSVLYENLQKKISEIPNDLWITNTIDESKYYLTVPSDGIYQLLVASGRGVPKSVIMDGTSVPNLNAVFLAGGVHKLLLNFEPENALSLIESVSANLSFQSGQEHIFSIPHISFQDPYVLEFNYRLTEGKGVYVSFHQDNDAKDDTGNKKRILLIRLLDDGKWHNVFEEVHPNFGAKSGEIVFFSADTTETQSVLDISALTVRDIQPAEVFAIRKNTLVPSQIPEFSTREVNSAFYDVAVTDAKGPYILRFDQTYDNGWRAFVVPKTKTTNINDWQLFRLLFQKSVDPGEHFALDGYANAWYVDSIGDYTVLLVYWPYVIFLESVMVSAASLLLGISVLCMIRKGRHG